ncbi:hypothetical protein [Agathobacter rectalis]|uniref:hypothetical protein n=1 Tax=Agathobacter rectalis TaxID=39491 RepID=UPI0036F40E07
MLVVGIKLIVRKMGFHKIGCLRQGISNCQCPRNRVSQKLDVYFLGYIIEKVAETAEITKTAPKLSPKARKKPAKTRQKVAEITINPKTA